MLHSALSIAIAWCSHICELDLIFAKIDLMSPNGTMALWDLEQFGEISPRRAGDWQYQLEQHCSFNGVTISHSFSVSCILKKAFGNNMRFVLIYLLRSCCVPCAQIKYLLYQHHHHAPLQAGPVHTQELARQ